LHGALNEERGFANRAAFVVDEEGKITAMEAGCTAIEVATALNTCRVLK